ncbi:hypothetical protein G7066_12805 [Leucobacter coleopterorum]|uniref:SipW-cognate class signal peptide n=1 Tax=Leucobacter coleopterorum TaxID=2714933 RepID=A0ABX6JY35_9MICO|nr:hypothetical protein [Leucobacter coleopterorum]QIM19228.1 hypothetical protein G7066_12805 [Leucobacter coleopterorum]
MTRMVVAAGVAAGLTAVALGANALWSARMDVSVPSFDLGAVRFAATAAQDESTREYSKNGGAVSVTLPGAKVLEVLEQTAVDPEPVIWRFTASGTSLGITGLNYSVAVSEQRTEQGSHDLSSGIAQPGTVLERSTLKVYRAAAGGDCSAVPATPELGEGETPRNVYVYDAADVELQAPGAAVDGVETEQEWCAALNWNSLPDGTYVNTVQAVGTAEDSSNNGATDAWHAAVGFPPALEQLGVYKSQALAEGEAEDTTKSRGHDDWFADLYPDPSGEPGIVITLKPEVTNLNKSFTPKTK